MKHQTKFLRDRIRQADSPEKIAQLLAEGDTFLHASEKTRRKWRKAAKARLAAMEDGE